MLLEEYKLLDPPLCCDNCQSSRIEYLHIDKLNWTQLSTWPYVWYCYACRAAVGCHKGTQIPLGKMANNNVRRLRAIAHESFDKLWKTNFFDRSEVYQKLSEFLGISVLDCHISQLELNQLEKVITWSNAFYVERIQVLQRRKVKRKNAAIQQSARVKTKIVLRKMRR